MIRQAQGHIQRNSFYFLFWGWTIALANLGMFILMQINYPYYYFVWLITVPAWVITIIRSVRNRKKNNTKTHFDSISACLWISFGIIIFTIVGFSWKINFQINPVILLVTAMPTFVSGIILKFRPLIFGAVCFWISGVICFLVPMEFQPLVAAVAIILGYLIPGYLLKYQNQ
jgi:hypothetical protein